MHRRNIAACFDDEVCRWLMKCSCRRRAAVCCSLRVACMVKSATNLVELNGEAVKPLPKAMPIFLQVLKVSASVQSVFYVLLPLKHGTKGVPKAMPIFFPIPKVCRFGSKCLLLPNHIAHGTPKAMSFFSIFSRFSLRF